MVLKEGTIFTEDLAQVNFKTGHDSLIPKAKGWKTCRLILYLIKIF